MGQGYLIDTNVIIDYTSSRLPQKGSDFVEQLFNNNFVISVAVKIEVLGFDDVPDKLLAMEEFVDTAILLPLDEDVTKQTILLRRKYKKLKLGDAIIAATAIAYNLVLVSRNTKDFENIEGLELINPHNI
jgi:predicted nucleic acid-binding protein